MIYTKCDCGCSVLIILDEKDNVMCSECKTFFNWVTGKGLESKKVNDDKH